MRFSALLLCLTMAAGCASGGATGASSAPLRNPDVITESELVSAPYSNAYDAIQHLRPQMLVQRAGSGSSSLTQQSSYAIKVYMDGVPIGGVADLRQIPLAGIKEIRYLGPTEATQRFGTGNVAGAIVIRSR
ncbi:MAG: TonB-dependent receptor plug domain-containing protein [Gemmatimonadota bacterium]|nr:TonB-dependent receptor plug domain-containing protein [Gemmatimonadota bacterium]MDE3215309.1 TonB-dependent receptor plug domain-containing protein [Gemmatimonadota bacterium]